ncbi:hypothetical protein [Novosphingobium umbonatum]|nr:hypothetical protein [Novosphingobium umbonatum]
MTPTGQRQLAINLVVSDPKKALSIARAIEDPWFNCQALAYIARYWPNDDYEQLLREAIKASDSQVDWYKRVAVSAWPIRAYLELGNPTPAKRLLTRYTEAANNIENMGGRSEALLMLFQAAKPFDRDLWEPVFHALVKATEPALAWRQTRNIRNAIAMVGPDDPTLLQEAIKCLTNEKTIAAIKRDIGNRKAAEPRPFFWLD